MRYLAALLLVALPVSARADDWLGPDKALHFGATAAIAGAGYASVRQADGDGALAASFGAQLGLAAGVGKELYDLTGRGDPSWKDLTWDVAGTACGVLTAALLDRVVSRWIPMRW